MVRPVATLPQTLDAPYISHLRLQDFRNYTRLSCAFGPRTNILLGANGVGKTNILEAVSLLGAGRGLRGGQFSDLTRRAVATAWAIGADLSLAHGASRIRVSFNGAGRDLLVDGDRGASFDSLSQVLPQLWLTPAMDRLFVEAASGRRKFFDRFAASLSPSLASSAAAYEKAMRERNRLLGEGSPQTVWLDSLEETMAVNGTAIAWARLEALDHLAAGIAHMPETGFPRARIGLEGDLETALRSESLLVVEDMFRDRLASGRGQDVTAGRTLFGPHRSDLLVYYADKNMPANQCSTGEQKALLIGLILAQAHSIAAQTGDVPLLLLDEVAAHLDPDRRQALAQTLDDLGGQVWITGTDLQSFEAFAPISSVFTVADDAVIPHTSATQIRHMKEII